MIKVKGRFDVSLPVAIDVATDLQQSSLVPCHFEIDNSYVTVLPLTVAEATVYPNGDYDLPRLTEIRVWISRSVDLGEESEKAELPLDEELKFEKILVKATRRFIEAVKQKTNQWDLDTRHPVYAYTRNYSSDDSPIATYWPQEHGTTHMPEYAKGIVTTDLGEELTVDIWLEVVKEASHPEKVPFYSELLNEAKVFRSQMRYEIAVLYAAISSELMLHRACRSLLADKGGLNQTQCDFILGKLGIGELRELVSRLEPALRAKISRTEWLFKLRNKLAHGEPFVITWQRANEAVRVAEQLRENLAAYL